MHFLPFQQFPLWLNIIVFVAGATAVWIAGTRLSRYAEALSRLTRLDEGFVGALLLGGITSLPEVATTISASLSNDAALAVNNIFGGVSMQVAILAIADMAVGKRAASYMVESEVVVMQGVLLIFMLSLTAIGLAMGELTLFWVGVWPTGIFAVFLFSFYLLNRYKYLKRWELQSDVRDERNQIMQDLVRDKQPEEEDDTPSEEKQRQKRRIIRNIILAGLVVLVAGFAVALSGEALSKQTGLGSSFFGAVFLAIATSLPEISTTTAALRNGNPNLAFSNIFGTNLFDSGLLFVADIFYTGGPILSEVGRFSQVGALLGILLTSIYLVGLVLKARKTIARMGYDSAAVLLGYIGGVILLYYLRE